VKMLKGVTGRRAVVVLTDGMDVNSKHTLDETITAAHIGELPVYTVGIGAPGKDDQVTTVLVLDCSGSMKDKADPNDNLTKMDALKRAAKRFAALMRPTAQTTLLPFADYISSPEPLTADKTALHKRIDRLEAFGETH